MSPRPSAPGAALALGLAAAFLCAAGSTSGAAEPDAPSVARSAAGSLAGTCSSASASR